MGLLETIQQCEVEEKLSIETYSIFDLVHSLNKITNYNWYKRHFHVALFFSIL